MARKQNNISSRQSERERVGRRRVVVVVGLTRLQSWRVVNYLHVLLFCRCMDDNSSCVHSARQQLCHYDLQSHLCSACYWQQVPDCFYCLRNVNKMCGRWEKDVHRVTTYCNTAKHRCNRSSGWWRRRRTKVWFKSRWNRFFPDQTLCVS